MKLETERDATEWLNAAKALAVVSAWHATGAFERLRAGPLAPGALGIEPRALATTLPVLRHVGILGGDAEHVSLTPAGRRLLEEGAMPSERHLDTLRDLSRMRDVLVAGGPVRDDAGQSKGTRGGVVDDPVRMERFLDMLWAASAADAEDVFHWLASKVPAKGAMLDVGGGHGRYARAFADAGHPATILDLPHVVAYARRRHAEALSYIEGDFHSLADFGGPYDVVLLSNIVHGESVENNAALVARSARSLRSGGIVAMKDMFLDAFAKGPANAVFFGVTMLFYTEQGRSPSVADVGAYCTAAGLEPPEFVVLGTQVLAYARKR